MSYITVSFISAGFLHYVIYSYGSASLSLSGSKRRLILRLATQRLLSVGSNWTRENFTDESTAASLLYEFRVVCQRNYFGSGCVRVCASRDDVFGHYDCDADGLRVCMNGWTGSYCETGQVYCRCVMKVMVCHMRQSWGFGSRDPPDFGMGSSGSRGVPMKYYILECSGL